VVGVGVNDEPSVAGVVVRNPPSGTPCYVAVAERFVEVAAVAVFVVLDLLVEGFVLLTTEWRE